jgi:hypothetical protein
MQREQTYPPSSLVFDWVMAALAFTLLAGVAQDGWAHNHGQVDQSFLTPWHAILYGAMTLNGIVLGAAAVRNKLRGYPVRYTLPYGYGASLVGLILFAIGGVFDLWWHTRYGIESDINALVSPSHLWLATGAALIIVGPIRSIAARYGRDAGGWKIAGPAIVSFTAVFMLIGFFTQYAQPIGAPDEADIIGKHAVPTSGALYSTRKDGTHQTRLLVIAGADIWGAAVSPDGKHVAYRVALGDDPRQGPSDIYVAGIDGTHARRITHSGRHDTQPAWSPDSKRIAFISVPAGTSGDYFVQIVPAGGGKVQTVLDDVTGMQFPTWSPDGKSIAYQSRNGLQQQIAVVASSGGTPTWLAATEGGIQPAWSSRNQIAFVDAAGSISTTTPSGTTSRELVRNAQLPAWSLDGKRLAYVTEAGGDSQVFASDSDGRHRVNISQLAGLDASRPSWTPGGDLIFTAAGRPITATTFLAFDYSEDAVLVESLTVAGIALLLIRRWRLPFGAMTFLLSCYGIALALQSDLYYEIAAAVITGLLADTAIQFLGERARNGFGFYALGFAIPAVLFMLYLVIARLTLPGGLGWPPNLIFGSPIIAGFAGMLIAFCFSPPLRSPETAP